MNICPMHAQLSGVVTRCGIVSVIEVVPDVSYKHKTVRLYLIGLYSVDKHAIQKNESWRIAQRTAGVRKRCNCG